MTSQHEKVLAACATPKTFGDLKAELPELADYMFDLTDELCRDGKLQRVKRVEAGAVFALPGAKVEGRKPDPPGPRIEPREQKPQPAPPKPAAASPKKCHVPHVAWKSLPPAPPSAIADALAEQPQEEKPMSSEWMNTPDAAQLVGVTQATLTREYKDKIRHEGGGKGHPLRWWRPSVEQLAAERKAPQPTPKKTKALALRQPAAELTDAQWFADGIKWLIDGHKLGKMTAEETIAQIAEVVRK